MFAKKFMEVTFMANLETVGSKIRACRKSAKLTQEKLAEMVKISPTYLSEIETDRKQAGREVLCRIAKVLDVSVDYLLYAREEHNGDIKMIEWKILFEDCSGYEQNVLFDLVRSAKNILRDNSRLLNRK